MSNNSALDKNGLAADGLPRPESPGRGKLHHGLFGIAAVAVLIACQSHGIAQQQEVLSPQQHKFFRYVLRTMGNLDYSQAYVADFEKAIVGRFALNGQEAAILHLAGQKYRNVLQSTRASEQSVRRNNSVLTAQDGDAFRSLSAQQEQAVDAAAGELLRELPAGTADRLRTAAKVAVVSPRRGN